MEFPRFVFRKKDENIEHTIAQDSAEYKKYLDSGWYATAIDATSKTQKVEASKKPTEKKE